MPPVPENVEIVFPEDGGCFGCSPTNPQGLRLRFRREGEAVHVRHTIADGFHGSISTLQDFGAGLAVTAIALLPWLLLGAPAFVLARRLYRRRKQALPAAIVTGTR